MCLHDKNSKKIGGYKKNKKEAATNDSPLLGKEFTCKIPLQF